MAQMIVLKEKSDKNVRFKTHKGTIVSLIREVYLRDDISCQSKYCQKSCQSLEEIHKLSDSIPHYILLDCMVASNYWEVFEIEEIDGIIVTLTTLLGIQQISGRRFYKRVKKCLGDPSYGCVLFDNEFHSHCFLNQKESESQIDYSTRLNTQAALWYAQHLSSSSVRIVFITDNVPTALRHVESEKSCQSDSSIYIMTLNNYLDEMRPEITAAKQLYESLSVSIQSQLSESKSNKVTSHLPQEALIAGMKSGQFFRGIIHVSKHNSMNEANVILSETSGAKDASNLRGEVLINGIQDRNRAVHGDSVCIEILPKSQWKTKPSVLQSNDQKSLENSSIGGDVMTTGRVVGILQRNWRDYVCSLPPDTHTDEDRSNRIVVTPWDRRIPKIRITTSQASVLKTQRFLVRLDNWEESSNYPNGHFVRALGQIGDLETETQTILIEHNLANRPFTKAQLSELPVDTSDSPWTMDPDEIRCRRDLRKSHLIFSIDPIGCQDVDDTLSVRALSSGNIELGVHIADVTYFVKNNSLLDLEARVRSTSIYMADRRFDMLPHALSGVLCSLWSNVDRYAVSVIWELSPNLEVLDVWYGRSVIRSRYKLFYEMAQKIYDNAISKEDMIKGIPELETKQKSGENVDKSIEELKAAIGMLVGIASKMKEGRMKQGGLELEGLEVQVQFSDPDRTNMEDIMTKQPLAMHETIAECMIFANHWVAKRILQSFPENACLRHHPSPRQGYFDELVKCAKAKGFEVCTDSNKTLAESLNRCVDPSDPEVNKILRSLVTQAMSNAMYFSSGSVPREEFAHYGLALSLYTHFTSPIRRYADIIVHRLLLTALAEANCTSVEHLMSNTDLDAQCQHMNEKHRSAQYANRVSTTLFQSLFFKSKDKQDKCRYAEAVIYQIKTNGILVQVSRYGIRGAVFLKHKDNTVAWIDDSLPGENHVVWQSCSANSHAERVDENHFVVTHNGIKQTYRIFDHVHVYIDVEDSSSHGPALRLDLVGGCRCRLLDNKIDSAATQLGQESTSKSDLFQSVRSADEEKQRKRKLDEFGDSEDENESLNKLHTTSSLYHFFLNAKSEDNCE